MTLQTAAFKAELAASRQLAQRTGMPEAQALRQVLSLRAGAAGLEKLLAERLAQREHALQRAAARAASAATARARRPDPRQAAWHAWFDGSARPNPGRCGIGAILEGPDGQHIELSSDAGYGNSSEAEYRALIAVLQAAVLHGASDLAIHGDSQVVVDDVNGPDYAGAPALRALRSEALALLARLPQASLRWIPRHKNSRADALSQRAIPLTTMEQPA
ncbi:ribonuclease HI family protein [Massilia niastensis]|uniref:ribonuclease HI family protein n=1 Tax=Massilia niastensis TaxID=544911 RepID=UPI001E5D8AD0|nr:ribonuclease HI family protein [Massilia niastensis]